MTRIRLLPRALMTAALALAVVAPAASADSLLSTTVSSADSAATDCTRQRDAGAAGVVQQRVRMPASGVVSAALRGSAGDWDVSIFDVLTKRLVSGSAGFGATELASGFVGGGRELLVQACRRSGSQSASLSVTSEAIAPGGPEDKPSLAKVFVENADQKAMLGSLGFDLTEHAGHDYVEVVLYGTADRRRLRDTGLRFDIEVDDLVAQDRIESAADRAFAQRTQRSALPSGRDAYRRLADYEAEMKALAERFPGLVKPLTLPHKSLEGREIHGIEITENANNVGDGKPVFLQMGVHHAREWPSSEHAMEFAHELVNGFNRNDPRIAGLVKRVRTIVVPVVNPDGFNVSREAPLDLLEDPQYEQIPDAAGGVSTANYLADPAGAYRRRNCRLQAGQSPEPGACALPINRNLGTDPNRNYGGLWGGPGASALPAYDTYRGADPFSEPETQNVRELVSARHVTTLITNHTFSNLVLRPPGVRAQGPPVDEDAMRDLGQRMADQNGYTNQPSYGLYDTTGTTEDWSYYTTGGFGYTFEIGPAEGEGSGFHPPFAFTVKQYTEGQDGAGGNREAYLIAMENAGDPAKHSTITGRAPKGVTLRLRKNVTSETSPVRPFEDDVFDGEPSPETDRIQFPDVLNTTMEAPGGRFTWSVNPSTRPYVATNRYRPIAETPTREQPFSRDEVSEPGAGEDEYTDAHSENETFTISEAEKGSTLIANVRTTGADDYDAVLFRRVNGRLKQVGSSGNLPSEDEEIILENAPAGEYVLRVDNYVAFTPYEGEFQIFAPGPVEIKQGTTEAWSLTCESGGKAFFERKIVIERGQKLDLGNVCGVVERGSGVCATASGFKSTSVKPAKGRRSVRLGFSRLVRNRVSIDVFQVSKGKRKILGERRVARFRRLTRSMSWDGTGNDGKRITDGVFFVRYKVKGSRKRMDFRRAVLVRRKGRFYKRKTHYRPNSCGLLSSAKLERPVFGGRQNRPLRVAYRTSRRARVVIQVRKGKKVVRTIRANGRKARRTHRFRIRSEGMRRGLYTVRIAVRAGKRRASTRLVSERL